MVKANSSLALKVGGGSQVGHGGCGCSGSRVGEVLSEAFGSSGVVQLLVHLMLTDETLRGVVLLDPVPDLDHRGDGEGPGAGVG